MRSQRWAVGFWCMLVAVVWLQGLPRAASAMQLVTWDLDSVVNKGEMIAEGEITKIADERFGLVEVRLSQVFRAAHREKKDDVLIVAASSYWKPTRSLLGGTGQTPLEVGDGIFLFGVPDKNPAMEKFVPAGSVIWDPLPGGIKLVVKGHVANFSQHMGNPGPLLAETEERYVKLGQPTVEDFRKQVETSLKDTAGLVEAIRVAREKKDAAGLVVMLKKRSGGTAPSGWTQDLLADQIGEALGELHDFAALSDAMTIAGLHGGYQFRRGFATPEGADYLLKRIGDPAEAMADRVRLATVLPRPADAAGVVGAEGAPKTGYMTRVAALAEGNAGNELCNLLIRDVGGWLRWGGGTSPQPEDRSAALEVLKRLYAATKDEERRYQIELATWNGSPEAYAALGSKCGSVLISTVRSPEHPEQFGRAGRKVVYQYEFWGLLSADGSVTLTMELVLDSASGKSYTLATRGSPFPMTIGHGAQGGGSDALPVPADVPDGDYRVFVRWTADGKVVGESHAMVVTVK